MAQLLRKIEKDYIIKIAPPAVAAWIVLSFLQYYFFGGSFVEAAARAMLYAGGLMISLALLTRPLAKSTHHNLISYRHTFGVCGFAFMILHYLSTMYLSHNGLLVPSLAASGLSFLGFIGEL